MDNIHEAIEALEADGVECEPVRIDPLTGQRFTFFSDPDGLPLELYESRPAKAESIKPDLPASA